MGKIFCIGLNKTGSTSLHHAFILLGYKSIHYQLGKKELKEIIKTNHQNGDHLLSAIDHYDAYSDWSGKHTHKLFKLLDIQYPGSKFILSTREIESWLESREKHVKRIPNLKELQQKYPDHTWYNIDKDAWRKEYFEHHRNVKNYFTNRENDLLVYDLFNGDGWDKLCKFLDKEKPNQPFPKSNTAIQSIALNLLRNHQKVTRNT